MQPSSQIAAPHFIVVEACQLPLSVSYLSRDLLWPIGFSALTIRLKNGYFDSSRLWDPRQDEITATEECMYLPNEWNIYLEWALRFGCGYLLWPKLCMADLVARYTV